MSKYIDFTCFISFTHFTGCNDQIAPFLSAAEGTQMYKCKCPSVCLCVCPPFLTTFPKSDFHEIDMVGVSWKK